MKISISYKDSLTFEQFKKQFGKHFAIADHVKKESQMKKAWSIAELSAKRKESPVALTIIVDGDKGE